MEDNADSNQKARAIITEAIKIVVEMSPQETDGKWLESVTVDAARFIKEWDVAECWLWDEWPEREKHFPNSTKQDIGIDVVAKRKDGEYIAIQCKARKLDEQGAGNPIASGEIDKFISASANPFWKERWIVTNGANPLSPNAQPKAAMSDPKRPIKLINIRADLAAQQKKFDDEERAASEHCAHCENPEDANAVQTKSCMQNQAIAQSVRILQEHAQSDSGGLPIGQARGRIILPCGTGKTRISLRIVEELTPPGKLSIVLCPSIALVAQIRREYLQHAAVDIRPLAVCSDETAGYDPKKEDKRNTAKDPTLDNSNTSVDVIKGKVSTNPADIASWIKSGQKTDQISVIFGTYQSGRALADALQQANAKACVLIADEAHRTAGLRRKRAAKNKNLSDEERRIRDFTLCHDRDEMPATHRVYQTATPRIYDPKKTKAKLDKSGDWLVRSMDDEQTFGVELYRKSYKEAVHNQWLSDYRIIAVAVNGPDEHRLANELAGSTESQGKQRLTTYHFLRGLAFTLAMGGAARSDEKESLPIKSCIAFLNTVDKSKNMAKDLQTDAVRKWLQDRLDNEGKAQTAAQYQLEHLDASSKVIQREEAKRRLANAVANNPHGILNVGIFGEGTDAPSLSAVAFLESRKSPIDVVQAVGRAMRTSPGKEMGYIICPIVIPLNADPENWLSTSNPEEGWKELGEILLALRAHDQRIEDQLKDLLHLYIPKPPESMKTIVGINAGQDKRTIYREHQGKPGQAQEAIERVLKGESSPAKEFQPLPQSYPPSNPKPDILSETPTAYKTPTEPTQIITGKTNNDKSHELRIDTVQRDQPAKDGTPGAVNIPKSKKRAHAMINQGEGMRLTPSDQKTKRKTPQQAAEQRMLTLISQEDERLKAITMNLLAKSGLTDNRIQRDLNILEDSIKEAAHHLTEDQLKPALNRHFELDNIKDDQRKKQADGCTIAALLMMNAAMLHQRISNGQWMDNITSLNQIKNATNPIRVILRQWNIIKSHDFKPVLDPAVKVIEAIEDTHKLAGLERALRHLAAEAERIAETYADMGADHAGILFNKVMGNQASDGAYFTRPPAADIAARLTLDLVEEQHLANQSSAGVQASSDKLGVKPSACGQAPGLQASGLLDWTDAKTWRACKTFDPAVGSGILLVAMLAEMKRRARIQLRARRHPAPEVRIAQLQKLAVEELLVGMDVNPVSLQLAASALTIGNRRVGYRKMQLHLMPYGPQADGRVKAGTLELLSQKAFLNRRELNLPDEPLKARPVWGTEGQTALVSNSMEDAVQSTQNINLVITNPPFTNRVKMGEKYKDHLKVKLRQRVDSLERMLVESDEGMKNIANKNALAPLFTGIAEKVIGKETGAFIVFRPTIVVSSPSGIKERIELAKRFHVHTIFTVHCPGDINLSQDVNINESILCLQRYCSTSAKPPTRFINLDRFPETDEQLHSFFAAVESASEGELPKDWGELSYWPSHRIERGDWTPAIWRSPELAEAAALLAECEELKTLGELGLAPMRTDTPSSDFEQVFGESLGSFPTLYYKGDDAQTTIQSQPDTYWIAKDRRIAESEKAKMLAKAGHLLISQGQRNTTARLNSVASDEKYTGMSFMPVPGLTADQAKALAVFLNSTAGRLQLLRNAGKTIEYPLYQPAGIANIRVPDVVGDAALCKSLKECWERTKNLRVPQYRDGDHWDGVHHPRHPQEQPKNWIDSKTSIPLFEPGKSAGEIGKSSSIELDDGKMAETGRLDADKAQSSSGGRDAGEIGESVSSGLDAGESGESVSSGLNAGQADGKVRVKHHACGVKQPACCNPRPIWDACVSKTLRKNPLFRLQRLNHLRSLLHLEPHIRGKPYHHRADELEKE